MSRFKRYHITVTITDRWGWQDIAYRSFWKLSTLQRVVREMQGSTKVHQLPEGSTLQVICESFR